MGNQRKIYGAGAVNIDASRSNFPLSLHRNLSEKHSSSNIHPSLHISSPSALLTPSPKHSRTRENLHPPPTAAMSIYLHIHENKTAESQLEIGCHHRPGCTHKHHRSRWPQTSRAPKLVRQSDKNPSVRQVACTSHKECVLVHTYAYTHDENHKQEQSKKSGERNS